MSGKTQVKVMRQALEFHRGDDDGVRFVTGPTMVASPAFKSGQLVAPEDLVDVIHYDGAFMTAPSVAEFSRRFMTKRPGLDLEHDGSPRRAWPVESYLTRAAEGQLTEGSHVVTAMSLDAEVNRLIDLGEIRAWSAQLMVKVEPVVVRMQTSDGEQPLLLMEFSDGDPQFLSFVKFPAIGVDWSEVKRSLSTAAAPAGWNEDAARTRIFDWAGVDGAVSVGLAAKFFPDFERSGFAHPVGDIVGGAPTLYLEAVRDACSLASGGQDVARVMRVMRTDVENGMAKWNEFVTKDLGIKTEKRTTDAIEAAPAPDTAPTETSRSKPEDAAPTEAELSKPGADATEAKRDTAAPPAATSTEAQLMAPTFDELFNDTAPTDAFWTKTGSAQWALYDAFWYAMTDSGMDAAEKQAHMLASCEGFSTVMVSAINELFTASASLSAGGDGASLEEQARSGAAIRDLITRAGAVLSKANRSDIELAAAKLGEVLERATTEEAEEAELSTEPEPVETPAVVERSEGVDTAAVKAMLSELMADATQGIKDAIRSELDTMKASIDETRSEVAKVRSAAPAPAAPSAEAAEESRRSEKKRSGADWGNIVRK